MPKKSYGYVKSKSMKDSIAAATKRLKGIAKSQNKQTKQRIKVWK